tara:strand:- start:573 stop:1076 length:504 start_codon:yes stop_codon:yes gene_type:complete
MALGLTGAGDITGGIFNRPLARVHLSSNQGVGDNSTTTIQFDQVSIDTNSCYNTSTYRFTPDKQGYYYFAVTMHGGITEGNSSANVNDSTVEILKNGTDIIARFKANPQNSSPDLATSHHCETITLMNGTSDYVEFRGNINTNSSATEVFFGDSSESTHFVAFRLHA